MRKNHYSGKFIVFEGLDGSGQTTQAELLAEFLKRRGKKVLKTKEPTFQSEAGKKIKKVLEKKEKVSSLELQKLFTQDRKWHLENIVIPALREGKIVISDRYFFSTFSYGTAEGVSLRYLYKINDDFLLPDLVFFLDVPPKISLERIEKRGKEKSIFEKADKLGKIYTQYKMIFQQIKKIVIKTLI